MKTLKTKIKELVDLGYTFDDILREVDNATNEKENYKKEVEQGFIAFLKLYGLEVDDFYEVKNSLLDLITKVPEEYKKVSSLDISVDGKQGSYRDNNVSYHVYSSTGNAENLINQWLKKNSL